MGAPLMISNKNVLCSAHEIHHQCSLLRSQYPAEMISAPLTRFPSGMFSAPLTISIRNFVYFTQITIQHKCSLLRLRCPSQMFSAPLTRSIKNVLCSAHEIHQECSLLRS